MSPTSTSRPLLRADAVTKRHGTSLVLNGVDLAIAPGEIVAISGADPAAASRLLHVLAGTAVPDTGTVHLGDRRVDRLPGWERRALLGTVYGFVSADWPLDPQLTVTENVALPAMLHGTSRFRAMRAARATVAALGLADVAKDLAGSLSTSQHRRVMMARALAHRPQVVFADEAGWEPDLQAPEGAREAMTHLVEAARQTGTALVVTTRDPQPAVRTDRTVRLSGGHLAGIGRAAVPVRAA